jgi:hypothetical protein
MEGSSVDKASRFAINSAAMILQGIVNSGRNFPANETGPEKKLLLYSLLKSAYTFQFYEIQFEGIYVLEKNFTLHCSYGVDCRCANRQRSC